MSPSCLKGNQIRVSLVIVDYQKPAPLFHKVLVDFCRTVSEFQHLEAGYESACCKPSAQTKAGKTTSFRLNRLHCRAGGVVGYAEGLLAWES